MKLIQPVKTHTDIIDVPMYDDVAITLNAASDVIKIATWGLIKPPKLGPSSYVSMPSRTTLSNCIIDFENKSPTAGKKIDKIKFDDGTTYIGVIPLNQTKYNTNIYECCVDYIQ